VFNRKAERIYIAVAQQLCLAKTPAAPNRPHSVDYVLCRKPACAGDNRLSHLAAADPVTFPLEFICAGGLEYCPAHPAAHLQFRICGINNGVGFHLRYIVAHYFKRHLHDPHVQVLIKPSTGNIKYCLLSGTVYYQVLLLSGSAYYQVSLIVRYCLSSGTACHQVLLIIKYAYIISNALYSSAIEEYLPP
jgi:hypothetical protein